MLVPLLLLELLLVPLLVEAPEAECARPIALPPHNAAGSRSTATSPLRCPSAFTPPKSTTTPPTMECVDAVGGRNAAQWPTRRDNAPPPPLFPVMVAAAAAGGWPDRAADRALLLPPLLLLEDATAAGEDGDVGSPPTTDAAAECAEAANVEVDARGVATRSHSHVSVSRRNMSPKGRHSGLPLPPLWALSTSSSSSPKSYIAAVAAEDDDAVASDAEEDDDDAAAVEGVAVGVSNPAAAPRLFLPAAAAVVEVAAAPAP